MKGKIPSLFLVIFFFNFASVEAGHVSCGQTIYTDTVLDSDLLNCPGTGIFVGSSGIALDCNGHTIDGTGSSDGIYTPGEQNVVIRNCNVTNFYEGISLSFSSNNNVLTNNVVSSNNYGIGLYSSSDNNIITNNVASNNDYGIRLFSSSSNTLTNNIASNNNYGIYLYLSNNNVLTGNTANSNNYIPYSYGIRLSSSSSNTLNQNSMSNNTYNFIIGGSSIDDFINFIDTTNTVNSRPVYYLLNSQDTTYDETTNAGFFACINCNNITVKNLNPSGNSHGILFANTDESSIINNALNSNGNGVALLFSSDSNTLTNNTANSNNYIGIRLESLSNNNVLTNNTANSNGYYGIRLFSSSNNNLIYNNYFNNTNNAWDDGANFWNINKTKGRNIVSGPLIAGNFWYDYSGQDTNGDGIGDTNIPYNSNGNIQNGGDYFPLVEPVISGRI